MQTTLEGIGQGSEPPSSAQRSRGDAASPPPKTIEECTAWARMVLRYVFDDAQFTTKQLLGCIELAGDTRGRGKVMTQLRREGLIEPCGVTTLFQESRHNGLATLWRKNV